MKRFLILLPLLFMVSCADVPQSSINSTEPTLQSAEDANTREFTEESFK